MIDSANKEREKRILDAAAALFTHYGFDKTTVSDIAAEAGVSKGAIYLHFESKENLLEALLLRELQAYATAWLARIEADPLGGTIGGLYKNSLYALNDNPFMSAVFRKDGRILGNYLRKQDNLVQKLTESQGQSSRQIFVQKMQEVGAVRDDIDAAVIAHIMNMLSYGLVSMDEILPAQEIPPVEGLIEGIAEIMDKALTPENGADSAAGKAIVRDLFEAGRQVKIEYKIEIEAEQLTADS
jgi:TetR/AcrR family acrAB operon transcriptional repressor